MTHYALPNTHYASLLKTFVDQITADGMSRHTVYGYRIDVEKFFNYLEENGITSLDEVNRGVLKEYQTYLYYLRQPNGKPYTVRTRAERVIGIRKFFNVMFKKGLVLYNWGKSLSVPRHGQRVPRDILTEQEVGQVLALPKTNTVLGYRDKVILELLYGTGIRNAELRALRLEDIKFEDNEGVSSGGWVRLERRDTGGAITIRDGKGGEDRVVPMGDRLVFLLKEYIEKVRPILLKKKEDHGYLILGRFGDRLCKNGIWIVTQRYAERSGLDKKISCHVFRHSIATHLLDNGMDIRYIQTLLGHKSLNSTQIYTRVTIKNLRKMYRKFHPRERRGKSDDRRQTGNCVSYSER